MGFFLVVFSRKFPVKRLFKKRSFRFSKLPTLRYGTMGIYCLHTFRFEYRYYMFFRKFFRRFFRRRRRRIRTLYKRRTWLYIRPNYVLTHKSKNARMGKGKGNFKRWCTIVYPGRIFIEHLNYSPKSYKKYVLKMRIKLKLKLQFTHAVFKTIKKKTINTDAQVNFGTFLLFRVRRSLKTTQRVFYTMIHKK